MLKLLIFMGILYLAWVVLRSPGRGSFGPGHEEEESRGGSLKGEKDITSRTRIVEEKSDSDR